MRRRDHMVRVKARMFGEVADACDEQPVEQPYRVMMPEIVTTTVMSLPSGVTWTESSLGIGQDKGCGLGGRVGVRFGVSGRARVRYIVRVRAKGWRTGKQSP